MEQQERKLPVVVQSFEIIRREGFTLAPTYGCWGIEAYFDNGQDCVGRTLKMLSRK